MGYTNGLFDCQSPTSPFLGNVRVLHLLEDMRAALDLMDPEEKESLRSQVSETTAEGLMEWLQGRLVSAPQIDYRLVFIAQFIQLNNIDMSIPTSLWWLFPCLNRHFFLNI